MGEFPKVLWLTKDDDGAFELSSHWDDGAIRYVPESKVHELTTTLKDRNTEIAELKNKLDDAQAYIRPVGNDRETEIAALKAMVNELREALEILALNAGSLTEGETEPYFSLFASFEAQLHHLRNKTKTQSLHDYCAKCTKGERSELDMRIAEKVREACLDNCTESCGCANDIRNIDLEEAMKDGSR